MSYKNPAVPLIANPENLDRPIQELQIELGNKLPWLEKSFGRTWLAYRKQDDKDYLYPEAWGGEGEDPQDLLCNDNLDAYSFFKVEDPGEYQEYASFMKNRICYTINIIFWINIERLNLIPTYRATEPLKREITETIKNFAFPSHATLEIERIYEEARNVYRDYSIDMVSNQVLVYPHIGFRFECRLCYKEDC